MNKRIIFHGHEMLAGVKEVNMTFDGHYWSALPLHLEIINHSPDGFNWGYQGSGPAQLALALLYESLLAEGFTKINATKEAVKYHQDVKREFLAKQANILNITSREITSWYLKTKKDEGGIPVNPGEFPTNLGEPPVDPGETPVLPPLMVGDKVQRAFGPKDQGIGIILFINQSGWRGNPVYTVKFPSCTSKFLADDLVRVPDRLVEVED